eukprot:999114-Pleurochrysis_carterae.AAC.2
MESFLATILRMFSRGESVPAENTLTTHLQIAAFAAWLASFCPLTIILNRSSTLIASLLGVPGAPARPVAAFEGAGAQRAN